MEDQNLLDPPNSAPPSIPSPGAESLTRVGTRLPTRSTSRATSKPLKIWNTIWDDWYEKTGKVLIRIVIKIRMAKFTDILINFQCQVWKECLYTYSIFYRRTQDHQKGNNVSNKDQVEKRGKEIRRLQKKKNFSFNEMFI